MFCKFLKTVHKNPKSKWQQKCSLPLQFELQNPQTVLKLFPHLTSLLHFCSQTFVYNVLIVLCIRSSLASLLKLKKRFYRLLIVWWESRFISLHLHKLNIQLHLEKTQNKKSFLRTRMISKPRLVWFGCFTCSIKRFTTRFNPSIVLLSLNFFSLIMEIVASSGNDMWKLQWAKWLARSSITEKIHCSWKFWDFNQFLGSCKTKNVSSFIHRWHKLK